VYGKSYIVLEIVTGGLMDVCKEIEFKMFMAMPNKVFISRLVPSKYHQCSCDRCITAKRVTLLLTFGKTMCSYRVCMFVAREIKIRVENYNEHNRVPEPF